MRWLCDIRLPSAAPSAAQARAVLARLDLPIPDETRNDLRLLISEVTTNAVRHGTARTASANASVRLRVGLASDCVRVEVQDDGPGFVHRRRGPRSALDCGWGVHLVDELAQRWGAGHVGGDWTVWFELHFPAVHEGRMADAVIR